jgi:hypothetical protein
VAAPSSTPSLSASPSASPIPSPTQSSTSIAAPGATRESAVPFGHVGAVGKWNIKVVSWTPNADEAMHRANQFNDKPKPGQQYALVTIRATNMAN